MSKKKIKKKAEISDEAKKARKGVATLTLFVLWAIICVAVYYLSIVKELNFFIHIYVWLSIPTLSAAVLINGYFNAKYGEGSQEKASPELIRKMKIVVKTCIFVGLPPISCVLIEYLASWLIEKF